MRVPFASTCLGIVLLLGQRTRSCLAPPVPLLLSPCLRLDLHPARASSRHVSRVFLLCHHPLQIQLLDLPKKLFAVLVALHGSEWPSSPSQRPVGPVIPLEGASLSGPFPRTSGDRKPS